jgi:hypothetical protein
MKYTISKLLTVLIFLATVSGVNAYNKVGSSVAQFLKIEAGPRALAMGGSFAAIADDPYSIYWNVAGMAQVNSISASLAHTRWIADLQHNFAAVVIPVGDVGNIGFSVTTLTSDAIEQTTIESPHGTGTFVEASDIAMGVSYARFMTEYIMVGATAKYIQQRLWDLTAQTVAFDIGFLLDTGYKGIKIGMTLNNFGPEMQMAGENLIRSFDKWTANNADPNVQVQLKTSTWPIPTSYRVSVSMDLLATSGSSLLGNSEDNRVLVALDALHPSDNPEHYAIGMEYAFRNMAFVRAGYKGGTDEQGLTMGAGFKTNISGASEIILDYAYADFGVFDYIQQFSLGFTF